LFHISNISWRSENLRARCTTLCERQLSDDRLYNKLDKDPTKQFSDEITNEYLIPDSPNPDRFYLLPTIHKANNPGRPIVSANGHPTEKISEFVDFHLRQHIEALPSFITDTTDYLKKWQL